MEKYKRIYGIVLLFLWMSMPINAQVEKDLDEVNHQHVLVLNAYHRGFGWTDGQMDAIMEHFLDTNVIIHVEYLDWKRYPDETNLSINQALIRYKYQEVPLDVIITTDDMGLQFALDNRSDLFSDVPIVFSGVFEDTAQARIGQETSITGVVEKLDVVGTVDMIHTLQPEVNHLYIVGDTSESGQDVIHKIQEGIDLSNYPLTYEVLDHYSYEEISTILSDPKDNSAVIMGSYNRDRLGESKPNELFCEELSIAINIPIYGPYDFLFDHGIVGGSLLSGRLQGETTVAMAEAILSGSDTNTIPWVLESTSIKGIDYLQLKRFDLDMKKVSDATIINKPSSIYQDYKFEFISGVIILVGLTLLSGILFVNVKLRKRAQRDLVDEHITLMETYEALAASEEELKAQNEALTEQQERIHYLAFNDALTGLPNRREIENAAKRHMTASKSKGQKALLVFLDLDNFNYINTAHGHIIGDKLLSMVAATIKETMGSSGMAGRIGGDEFVCIKALANETLLYETMNDLSEMFKEPFLIDDLEIYVSASMGYALYPDDGQDYDELLIRADMAMYEVKDNGKGKVNRFDLKLKDQMIEKIHLSEALKTALANEEMYVVYQPQYDYVKDVVVGYEALLRWEQPILGNIRPDIFIKIAENTGHIVDIGKFVLKETLEFINELNNPTLKVSVNISPIQLLQKHFASDVKKILIKHGVRPSQLEFEITETVLIESFDVVNRQLKEVTDLGIAIALDDFGTGYSSLTYLQKLPIHTLKIDKSFIDEIINEGNDHFFTRMIIDIGKEMGFRIVAEGVETYEQIEYLRTNFCHIIQGYWYSKPKRKEAFIIDEPLILE